MSDASIQLTEDGSLTLFSNRFHATYHSRKGAITESLHVYIEHGLKQACKINNKVNVGEVGLGSGMNAMLTYLFCKSLGIPAHYNAIEAYPIDIETIEQISKEIWNLEPELYKQMMMNRKRKFSDTFEFDLTIGNWPDVNPFSDLDILYYDAFAPGCQPDLWTENALSKSWEGLKTGGILVTYCAKGEVKRTLKSLGFVVENPPGPPGKREMTRAIKI